MAAFDQHALSTLLEQQRYEEIAPQLAEEELKVSNRCTSHAKDSADPPAACLRELQPDMLIYLYRARLKRRCPVAGLSSSIFLGISTTADCKAHCLSCKWHWQAWLYFIPAMLHLCQHVIAGLMLVFYGRGYQTSGKARYAIAHACPGPSVHG